MKKANYSRAYIGELPRLNRDKQLELCVGAIDEIDGVDKLTAIYEPKEFDMYVRNLRADEIAVVARLIALAEKKPKGRPGIAFVMRLLKLLDSKCIYILDAETGIKSTDGQAWYDHVESVFKKITNGRELTTENARKLAKKSHESREPGLVDEWSSPAMSGERDRMGQHWRDPKFKNAQEAIAASPDEELKTASVSTWTRIFGRRTVSRNRK